VFSSSVSIGDAINTDSQLKSDLKVAQMTTGFSLNTYKCSHCDKVLYHKTVRAKPWTLFHNLNYVWLHQVFFSFCLVMQFGGAYGLFYNISFQDEVYIRLIE
jgi:hypothetical protein